MSLPKELLDAVKQDKKMLAKKFTELKNILSEALKSSDKNAKANTLEIVKAVKDSDSEDQSTAFDSIIAQGKLAEEDIKLKEQAIELEKNLAASRRSLSEDEIAATQEQIALLKSDKLKTLEAKKEAREMSERSNEALEQIAENQFDLIKEFKSGFSELRGEGLTGLVKMLLIGIPAFLAGLTVGIVKEIKIFATLIAGKFLPFLKSLKSVQLIFDKIGGALKVFKATKFFASVQSVVTNIVGKVTSLFKALKASRFFRMARVLFSRKGFIGKFFLGIVKNFKGIFSSASTFIKGGGMIANMFGSLAKYAQFAFKLGGQFAKLLGPIGIAITVITGLIGGIKGAFKGFKEDGIVGMLREGIIGVFNALIGGLVKMVGSLIGGIFKLLGFEKIGETIKSGFSDFIDGIVGAFRGLANLVGGLFTLNFGMLKEGIGQMLDGVINILLGIVKGIGGIIIGALAGIVKAAYAILVKLPIAIIKFMGKAWKFIYFDLPIMAFKLIFKALKFLLIDLPIKLIKFMGKAWKFIYFDLPIMAFKLIFKALKFILLDIPLKLVGFAAGILKAIFFDLPVKAFTSIFDGIKFMFTDLPGMLIDKVKSFFTSMVDSIGDAFSSAFDFVKRIGKASLAALGAALPGGESPKEAFLRVMGGESGGEETEEKENKEKIEKSVTTKNVQAEEYFMPQIRPKQKETADDFEARMMATIGGDIAPQSVAAVPTIDAQTPALGTISATETGVQSFSSEGLSSDYTIDDSIGTELKKPEEDNSLFGKIKGIGNMMKNIIGAPFKLLGKIKDSVLGMAGDGVDKVKGIAGGAAAGLKGIGEAGLGALKTFAGFTPPGLIAKGFGKLFGKKKKKEDGVLEGPEGMTPVLSSETNETDEALKDAKREQYTGNIFADEAFRKQMVLSNFNNKDEQFVSGPDQIQGEDIIRDNQYEMVRRDISPEDLEYVDSMKNSATFAYQSDDRIKQILDDGVKKKLSISDEDFTFDKRKEIVKGQLEKEEEKNRAQARDAKATIQQIEDGTYNPKALTPAVSIAGGPEDAKVPQKLSFMDIIKKGASFAKTAASFTPPGMLISGASKLGGLAKSEGGGFFEKIREAKEQKRIATRENFGGGGSRSGSELTMGQKENAELTGKNQGGGGAVIAPSSSVNNSKSSVTNTTIAAPPHIDRTQNLFGNTVLDW